MYNFIKSKTGLIICALLIVVIIGLVFLFAHHYQKLHRTIEQERVVYISEIKDQLIENLLAEKTQQMALVDIYNRYLLTFSPDSFKDLKTILGGSKSREDDKIFLLDENGYLYDLDGVRSTLVDQQLSKELILNHQSVFTYSQLIGGGEYWFYGVPTEELYVDGILMKAILNARSIQEFGKRMSTSILNDNGYSFVTSKEGSVRLFPVHNTIMGYNLFSTLEKYGVPQKEIISMQADFLQGIEGQKFLAFNDNRWLVEYSGNVYEDWVVIVMMPMTITGADTYRVLGEAITVMVILFGCIFLFLFLIARYTLAREKALHAERLKLEVDQRTADTKNQFLAKMSHDIRTPLNAIIGLLQITDDMVVDRPVVADNLEKIGQSAEYLLSLLNDILDMSKIESGKMHINMASFNLGSMLSVIKTMNISQAARKGIDFTVESTGNVDRYYIGDSLRLNQILMNLLSNAIKFTGQGGIVRLRVDTQPTRRSYDRVTFIVEDTGIGMSKEYMERIFSPFEQEVANVALNYAGSGLGLSIVKNLVECMGGKISVASEKGEGSRFEVTFFLEHGTEIPQDDITSEIIPDINLEGQRILLAEDNELNAMIASELLQKHCGLTVDIAENGVIAYERFVDSEKDTYCAILMDIRMPEMDGLETTKAIRTSAHPRAKRIPIIAMSANAFEEDVALSLSAGMNGHLSKPINVDKVEFELRKQLHIEKTKARQ